MSRLNYANIHPALVFLIACSDVVYDELRDVWWMVNASFSTRRRDRALSWRHFDFLSWISSRDKVSSRENVFSCKHETFRVIYKHKKTNLHGLVKNSRSQDKQPPKKSVCETSEFRRKFCEFGTVSPLLKLDCSRKGQFAETGYKTNVNLAIERKLQLCLRYAYRDVVA